MIGAHVENAMLDRQARRGNVLKFALSQVEDRIAELTALLESPRLDVPHRHRLLGEQHDQIAQRLVILRQIERQKHAAAD